MITNFEHAMRLNRALGQYWFNPDVTQVLGRHFGSFAPAPYGGYFAYTNDTTLDGAGPQHRVAYINDAGYVNPSYTGEGSGHLSRAEFTDLMDHKYASLNEASQAAREMAREAWGRR